MAPGEVVCSILLPTDELFRMEQLAIDSSPNLIDNGRLSSKIQLNYKERDMCLASDYQ